jgi:hydrogenase maturation protease
VPPAPYTGSTAYSRWTRGSAIAARTLSLADVIELARALGRLPARLTGYGIEGGAFELGTGLSPAVEAAVEAVTSRLLADLKAGV